MFIRAYLRASTEEQDASRAQASLEQFASDHNKVIASVYLENASGASADRPELLRLLKDRPALTLAGGGLAEAQGHD
jgi:DNA invertase Pin-like site-specific DNA recombinase